MNILPLSVNALNYNNYRCINKPSEKQHYASNAVELSNVYYPLSFCASDFSYKPVALRNPNYDTLDCDYSSLHQFSGLYANKINSQLKNVEYNDISALVNRIKMKTGADEKLITDVLYKLTLYSNYKAIDFLQDTIGKLKAGRIGISLYISKQSDDISVNSAINYFANNKNFLYFECSNKSMVILDGILLDELENSKKEGTGLYKRFLERMNMGTLIPVILKGFDIECSDKKYRSAAFLYGSGHLEGIALDTIKRMQKGENLDDILYLNIEKRYKNLIKDDIEEKKQTPEICSPEIKNEPTKKDVYENMKNVSLDPLKVEHVIDNYLRRLPDAKAEALTKYLDKYSIVYSFDTMARELTKMHEQIKEKSNDDVLYTLAYPYKSEQLITHLYFKINNVPLSQFKGSIEELNNQKILQKTDKKVFVLDDMSISGQTVMNSNKKFKDITSGNLPNHGLILTSDASINNLERANCNTDNILYMNKIKQPKGIKKASDKGENRTLPISRGFKGGGYLIAFPYIIPDNCSDIAADLFNELLIEDNQKANKAGMIEDIE